MKFRFKRRSARWTAVAVIGTAALAFVASFLIWLWGDDEWRFVEDVLLSDENAGGPVVMLWVESPTIALIGASSDDEAFVREAVVTFNTLMEGSGVAVGFARLGVADIEVFFTPKDTFQQMAADFGGRLDERASGYYAIKPNERFEITRAIALVGSELEGDNRRAAIVHELAHILGLRNHSSEFSESVVFENEAAVSTAIRLAPIDRKLLKLMYRRLKPGDGWGEVRWAFETHWRK